MCSGSLAPCSVTPEIICSTVHAHHEVLVWLGGHFWSVSIFISFSWKSPEVLCVVMSCYVTSAAKAAAPSRERINTSAASMALSVSLQPLSLHVAYPGFSPWVGKIPRRRERLTTPVFWPGEFHGLYSPWCRKELDTTERLSLSLLTSSAQQTSLVP